MSSQDESPVPEKCKLTTEESLAQRLQFIEILKRQSKDQLDLLFGNQRNQTDFDRRTEAWEAIAEELNAVGVYERSPMQWRLLWRNVKRNVRKRLHYLPVTPGEPLHQWEKDIIDLHDMRAEMEEKELKNKNPPSNNDKPVTKHPDKGIKKKHYYKELKMCVDVGRLKCTPLQIAVIRRYLKEQHNLKDDDEDERWQRFVGVLNLLGPTSTAFEWLSIVKDTNESTASDDFKDATELSEFEQQTAEIPQPLLLAKFQSKYDEQLSADGQAKIKHVIQLSGSQMDVLMYYLELYPFMWSPTLDSETATSAWQELTGWLNLLGYGKTVANWRSYMAGVNRRIRARFLRPLASFNDRLLYNLARRTASSALNITSTSDVEREEFQRCGQVTVTFGRLPAGDEHNVLAFECAHCPQLEWSSGEQLEQHIHAARHFDIECVQVKTEIDSYYDDDHDDDEDGADAADASASQECHDDDHDALRTDCKEEHEPDGPPPKRARRTPRYSPATAGPLQCDMCKRTFSNRQKLRMHMYIHIREAKFQACGLCDQKHEAQHCAQTDSICEECDMPFVTVNQRSLHFKASHMRAAYADVANAYTAVAPIKVTADDRERRRAMRWQCQECSEVCVSRKALGTHMTTQHGCLDFRLDEHTGRVTGLLTDQGPRHAAHRVFYRCNLCPFSNKSKSTVTLHLLQQHSSETPYMCSRCPQSFRRKACLVKHRQEQHGGGIGTGIELAAAAGVEEPTFVCEQCGECFERKCLLDGHLFAKHSVEMPYKCFADGCSKSFRSIIGRRQHFLAFHGVPEGAAEPPIACDFCEQRFYYSSGINEHMRKTHPKELVRCDLCDDLPAMEWKARIQHRREVHPEMIKRGRKKRDYSDGKRGHSP